jgi:repressor LexA
MEGGEKTASGLNTAHVGRKGKGLSRESCPCKPSARLMNAAPTARQAQFLAYIHQYSMVNGCAPAEADMQRFFQITPPSVHSMVLTLERRGLIRRVPGQARSITLVIPPESLPPLTRIRR